MFCKVSTNDIVEFGSKYLFKTENLEDMNFLE